MRIKINFSFDILVLPLDYQHAIQAFLYQNMSPQYSEAYHSNLKGKIKPFVFSRIFGEYSIKAERLVYNNEAHFYFASNDDSLVMDICKNLLSNTSYNIYSNRVAIDSVHILKNYSPLNNIITYKTISPVVLYQNNMDNKRVYPHPDSDKYRKLIVNNIQKRAVQNNLVFNDIEILEISSIKKGVYKYKTYMYTGYDYSIAIKADENIHSLIQDTGIGYRNPIGFGMIESINK